MSVGLGIAGLIAVVLAVGHASIGVFWVLPRLSEDRLPATPFGPPPTTLAAIRVTWHVVISFALLSEPSL